MVNLDMVGRLRSNTLYIRGTARPWAGGPDPAAQLAAGPLAGRSNRRLRQQRPVVVLRQGRADPRLLHRPARRLPRDERQVREAQHSGDAADCPPGRRRGGVAGRRASAAATGGRWPRRRTASPISAPSATSPAPTPAMRSGRSTRAVRPIVPGCATATWWCSSAPTASSRTTISTKRLSHYVGGEHVKLLVMRGSQLRSCEITLGKPHAAYRAAIRP